MRDYNSFRDYNPLENMIAAISDRASQMLSDVITGPTREAQKALIDNINRSAREAQQTLIDNINRPAREAQQAMVDNITRPTREAQRALIDSITGPTREAHQGMIDNIAARLPVFSPEVYLPSMSGAAFDQKAIQAIDRLRVFADLRATIDALEQLRGITKAGIPKVFQDSSERRIEQISRLVASATYSIVNQIERFQSTHFRMFDYSMPLNAAIRSSIPSLDGLFPSFLADYLSGIVNKPLSEFNEADIETVLHDVEGLIASRIQESGKSIAALQFWLPILLSLAFFVVTTLQGNRATTELKREIVDAREDLKRHTESSTETIAKATERILGIVKSIVPERSDEVLYVVQRRAELRLKPNSRSATLTTLYSNQIVSVCQHPGRWICVEFYDFNEGVTRKGWMYKKYLKRVGQTRR